MFSCASTCVGGVHLFCWASASFVGICMLWASIFWVGVGGGGGSEAPDRRPGPTNGRGVTLVTSMTFLPLCGCRF